MTREEKEQTGKYVLQMARLLEDGCYQQEMLLKAAHIIDEALEQEPTTKNDLVVEYISRADVNQVIEDYMDEQYHVLSDRTRERAFGANAVMARINELPSITPTRPKGHWIEYSWNDNGFGRWGLKCDKCLKKYKYGGEMWGHPCFCPNCGADMREVEE